MKRYTIVLDAAQHEVLHNSVSASYRRAKGRRNLLKAQERYAQVTRLDERMEVLKRLLNILDNCQPEEK